MGINLLDKGYNDVTTTIQGEFIKLPAGGYVCRIIFAEFQKSKAGNLMLVLSLDIADGEFAGYFKNATDSATKFNKNKTWDNSGIYRQLLFDNSNQRISSFFKGLISCIENSNDNFKINLTNFEPSSLLGKFCGFVFANEEYQKRDGSIGEHSVIKFPKTVSDIRSGHFKIPNTKKFEKPTVPISKDDFDGTPVPDDDLPF